MTGFVFGKFLPFHKGHQALIEFALTQCDELIVLICCSDREKIPPMLRYQWISEIFKDQPKVRLILLEYKESELPNSSIPSVNISRLWSRKFLEILPKVDFVFTSEGYGEYVAEFMDIQHIPFDPSRQQVPIYATLIRKDPVENWEFIPDIVKPYYQQKIVLLGTESTGKTTLAKALAKQLNASLVTEAGRDLIPDSTKFSEADLYQVAHTHAQQTEEAIAELKPILILDTDVHITQSYAHFSFGQYLDLPESYYQQQKGDIYLYLNAEAPFVQDGTRLSKAERDALDASHRATLAHFGVYFMEIAGTDWAEREQAVFEQLELVGYFIA